MLRTHTHTLIYFLLITWWPFKGVFLLALAPFPSVSFWSTSCLWQGWGLLRKTGPPSAQVVIPHHPASLPLADTASCSPSSCLIKSSVFYSSIHLHSFFFSFSSSSCPCQLGLSQPPPRFDNATPSQLFSVLSKHKGSRGVSIKVFRRPEADRCFGTCFSTPEMPNFCC